MHLIAVAEHRDLRTTERGAAEVRGILKHLGHTDDASLHLYLETMELVSVAPAEAYTSREALASITLLRAPASRNGNTNDAHILALAWALDADIWSHDRDFAGTGWPSWSSANLAAALSAETA